MTSKKIVDLDSENTSEVEVFDLYGVANQIGQGYDTSTLTKWMNDDEIVTPKPSLKVNGKAMWDRDGIDAWKVLWDKQTQRERELEEERLNSESIKKASLIEFLLEDAKTLERLNSRAYSHNRGNSKSDGRRRVLEFEGKMHFVHKLLGNTKMPAEKRTEINELLRKAAHHVDMK